MPPLVKAHTATQWLHPKCECQCQHRRLDDHTWALELVQGLVETRVLGAVLAHVAALL